MSNDELKEINYTKERKFNKRGQELDINIDKSMYYNANQLFSYNAIFSFALGERGNGKTTQGLKIGVSKFKKGFCTLYIRRTKEELKMVKSTICNGISELEEYSDLEFTYEGDWWYINGEPFIYCMALSDSAKFKSASLPDFDFILFDEYILTKTGHNNYLTNEMVLLLDLVSTVFRERKKTVYLASNSVSYANPFFDMFDIRPKKGERFIKQYVNQPWGKEYTIVVELTDTKEYQQAVKNSTFAKMLEGTTYYQYAICNDSLEDNTDFIVGKKPREFNVCMFNININGRIYGFWRNNLDTSTYYVGSAYDKTKEFPFNYSVYKNDISYVFKDLKYFRNSPRIKYFGQAFFNNRVVYENISIKSKIYNEFVLFIK